MFDLKSAVQILETELQKHFKHQTKQENSIS